MTTLTAPATPIIPEPATVAEIGIDPGVLMDLTLKTMFYRGRMTRSELCDALKVSGAVMQELMQSLTQDNLASVLGSEGTGPAGYQYALTQKGIDRADAALARSGYVGPAPVPLMDYIAQVRAQTIGETTVTSERVLEALHGLVLSEETVSRIGRAAGSGRSTLIHGASGNGKTTVVRALGAAVEGTIQIPYAIEMVGQIVHLFDISKHKIIEDPEQVGGLMKTRSDRRWIRIRRPVIWAGGELTRHSLELMYDENTKVYEAPLQLKANGGTLIIDDFGRQQIPAVQLLNRWIVALEGGVDHLTLHTGQTIEVPFDVLVLFSTNLPPERLADEAFLRRIRYKVELPNPTRDEYRTIFHHECDARGVSYSNAAVDHLIDHWYDAHDRPLRGCHPRDLVEAIVDAAQYDKCKPELTVLALDEACNTYFLRSMNAPA
ncbi:MAG: ATP-binding protein [Chloroflexota bacterium]|nr:ATP-binding protein [Chloroflexota bacterium]